MFFNPHLGPLTRWSLFLITAKEREKKKTKTITSDESFSVDQSVCFLFCSLFFSFYFTLAHFFFLSPSRFIRQADHCDGKHSWVHRRLIANKILIRKGIALIPGVNCPRDFHFYSTGTLPSSPPRPARRCISASESIATFEFVNGAEEKGTNEASIFRRSGSLTL